MTAMIVEELARIPMSPHLAATLTRAADYAVAQGHTEVTLEHLLLALAEDQEAAIVLTTSSVDLGRLAADVSDYLARSERPATAEAPGTRLSMDLRRILEAAAAAAQQGRRREINGAIVLAAIVGDGKSAAAHMLRAQGLTFEEAIKALQKVVTPQRTEDVLANARERVQSRSIAPPQPEPREATQRAEQVVPQPQHPQRHPQQPEYDPTPAPPAPAYPQNYPEPDTADLEESAAGWAPPPHHPPMPQGASHGQQPASPSGQGGRIAIPRANHIPAPIPAPSPGPMPGFPPQQARPAAQNPAPILPPPIPQAPAREDFGDTMGSAIGGAPDFGAQIPSQAPWADPGEALRAPAPMPQRAQAPANSQINPGATAPSANPPVPAKRRGTGAVPFPGAVPHVESGQLVENIPRKMRRGLPVVAEARIGRADLKALTDGLQGGGAAYHHEVVVTKAMSVRLRAPEGGFWIEPRSPETQWIENILGLSSDEYASWRWTVTPRTSGNKQLQIIVSARTMGADGMTADTALPDQVIDVKVGINYGETIRRVVGWTAAAIAGGVLARFGDGIFEMAQTVVTRIASGN